MKRIPHNLYRSLVPVAVRFGFELRLDSLGKLLLCVLLGLGLHALCLVLLRGSNRDTHLSRGDNHTGATVARVVQN
jgi:hypothetical protein